MKKPRIFLTFVGLFFISFNAHANTTCCCQQDNWHFLIAPYGWMSSLKGDTSIKNRSAQVSLPFRDILYEYVDVWA
jgi:hypothetical protein